MSISNGKILNFIVVGYYIILAGIVFLSWKNNEIVLLYMGFMRGKMSKAVFLMFCACMVFPFN